MLVIVANRKAERGSLVKEKKKRPRGSSNTRSPFAQNTSTPGSSGRGTKQPGICIRRDPSLPGALPEFLAVEPSPNFLCLPLNRNRRLGQKAAEGDAANTRQSLCKRIEPGSNGRGTRLTKLHQRRHPRSHPYFNTPHRRPCQRTPSVDANVVVRNHKNPCLPAYQKASALAKGGPRGAATPAKNVVRRIAPCYNRGSGSPFTGLLQFLFRPRAELLGQAP